MFPISSLTSSAAAAQLQPVSRTAETSAVNGATINAVGSATDAPPASSVTVDLSPVASFLLSVTYAQEQLSQTQSNNAQRAETVAAAVQNVVDSFNLLPSVGFEQEAQEATLLNNLVGSLNRQNNDGASSQAQDLARVGVTLQPPLLSDLTGGLSLEPERLRTAVYANNEQTTSTLQNTLNTFRQIATDFAEQLSAAGSSQIPGLNPTLQPALTPADLAANARLDLARATLDTLSQNPLAETIANRLAAPRAQLEQPVNVQPQETPSPIVNQQQQTQAALTQQQQLEQTQAGQQVRVQQAATLAQNAQPAQVAGVGSLQQALAANQIAAEQARETATAQAARDEAQQATAARSAAEQAQRAGATQAAQEAQQAAAEQAQETATAPSAAEQAQAAAQAQQAEATQNAAAQVAIANSAAQAAAAQAQAAQNAADALAAQNAAANAAAAQARAAQSNATGADAATAAAVAAQQVAAARETASNLAAANAAAARAAQQAAAAANAAQQASAAQSAAAEQIRAAQLAAAQNAANAPTDPLRANPALAAAIAAYNINDVAGTNARTPQTATAVIPAVGAVNATAATRSIGTGQ
ncbi:hypothetical protein [Duganella sp. BuS-21]|uniref:hypothetical protein n=1 Tax=Duganella sp. BuS-21 TaxID=2943848 RepID=UPI0035A711A5